MHNKQAFLAAFIAVMLFATSSPHAASTASVTLTGWCNSTLINQTNSYLNFSLRNVGNDTALNMVLIPVLDGASTRNTSVPLQNVLPGKTYVTRFKLDNFTAPGSYVEYVYASYSQGASTFTTIFPCRVNIGVVAPSAIVVLGMNITTGVINLRMFNTASRPISANVSVHAPLSFTMAHPTTTVEIPSQSAATASFNITYPDYTESSFPIASSVSYTVNGVHYTSLAITNVNLKAHGKSGITGYLLAAGIASVIASIVALMVISTVRKRRSHPSNAALNDDTKPN